MYTTDMSFGGPKDATHSTHTQDCTNITIDAADKIYREKCGHVPHTTQHVSYITVGFMGHVAHT